MIRDSVFQRMNVGGGGGSHSLGIIEIRIKFFVLGALKCWDHSSAVN